MDNLSNGIQLKLSHTCNIPVLRGWVLYNLAFGKETYAEATLYARANSLSESGLMLLSTTKSDDNTKFYFCE